ncbi:GDP-L-fucose synthase [bacterium]|nr:GDP-L-fucose synthase [Candidatus Omnitrophota bacterium]MBU2529215.1 GDP-L-fucose synthase [bacterium]MBU3930489.1 GDP-L-fucose synthase [bacterium]MBU4122507.1 GDP-L-fucose synthase [bacterium]
MDKNSKIYVAGHTGLVGSSLVRNLKSKGYSNLIFRDFEELNLLRQAEVENFFEKEKPEYVFLAAARVGGILANSTYTAQFIYENLMIAANVIDSSYKYGVKKLLNLGSSCIYPKLAPQPLKEEYLLTSLLEPTNEAYAVAKIAAIKLCRYYNQQYGTNFISVMPTNLYGPGDNFNLETAHVLPMLLRKFHLAKMLSEGNYEAITADIKKYPLGSGRDERIKPDDKTSIDELLGEIGITKGYVKIWGTGKPYREFLYSDDLADACVFLMEKYDFKDIGEFVNIGCGEDRTIYGYAELIKDVVGFKGEILTDPSRPDGTPRKLLDVSRLTALGWKRRISMEDGLKRYYEHYTGS